MARSSDLMSWLLTWWSNQNSVSVFLGVSGKRKRANRLEVRGNDAVELRKELDGDVLGRKVHLELRRQRVRELVEDLFVHVRPKFGLPPPQMSD